MVKRKRKEPLKIISSRVWVGKKIDDPIRPSEVHHEADEIADEHGKLQERYNWIDYHFERDGAYCRARTYLETIGAVAIFGPFAASDHLRPVDAPELREAVMAYLRRRFNEIKELKDHGYETVWKRRR